MTRDLANEFDRAFEALQKFLIKHGATNTFPQAEAAEAYGRISGLRDRLAIEPCLGDSWRDIFRVK